MGTVERALQLARAGKLKSVSDIVQALKKEGYEQVSQHLAGPTIARQLRTAITSAQAEKQRG